jgi:hypothetical protein
MKALDPQPGHAQPRFSGSRLRDDVENFSLVLGGPLFQLLRRIHLSDDALHLAKRRIVLITLLTWLPLLALTVIDGTAWSDALVVPFLYDWEMHIRFLVALPLLIAAELLVHRRIRGVVEQFLERDLIPADVAERFDAAIRSAFRLRNSLVAEVAIVAIVYAIGVTVVWRNFLSLGTATWYATPGEGGSQLTVPGVWFAYVALPAFQFLLLRWYFRIFIWARFLFQVARMPLKLSAAHPDRAGGLGFLGGAAFAFTPLAAAHGAMLAGQLSSRIFYEGAVLTSFKVEIGLMVALMLILVLGPLLFFAPALAQQKRAAKREYGALAQRYVAEFEQKWLRGSAPVDEPLVGSGDVQSLADLDGSLSVVHSMRVTPFGRDTLVQVVLVTLAPVAPLGLTMMPLEELLKTLAGILL